MWFQRSGLIVVEIVSALALGGLLLLATPAESGSLRLSWDPTNTESEVAGYRVYYRTSSGHYGVPIDVGLVTHYELPGLKERTICCVAVTAYDTAGNESDFSEEVCGVPSETLEIVTGRLKQGTLGRPYRQVLRGRWGKRPYSWQISWGGLPEGLSLDASNGVIWGTPVEEGDFYFTVVLTDSSSFPGSAFRNLSLSIKKSNRPFVR